MKVNKHFAKRNEEVGNMLCSDNAYYSIDTTITRIKKVLLEIKDNTAE